MKRLLLPALTLFVSTCIAQFTSTLNLNTVVSDAPVIEEAVPIAAGAGGNTMVTYFKQNPLGNPYDFYLQTLDENGNYVIGPNGAVVSNYPQNTAIFKYDMKADNEGNIVAAFQDERSGALDVVAYRVTPGGSSVWGPAGVACYDPAASGGIAPGVGILSSNDAIVAWSADGSPKDWISIQRITPLGVPVYATPVRIIDSTNLASYSRPQVVPMQNGDFMVLYVRQTGNFFPYTNTMFMRRYDISGQPVWAQPVQVSTKTITFFDYPSVIPDGNNGAYVAFASGNPLNTALIDTWVQHIDQYGNLWSATGTAAVSGVASQRMSPKIRFEGSMPHPVVLIKETDPGQSYSAVTIQAFDTTTGAALWTPSGVSVTTLANDYDEPFDLRDICGNMMIAFTRANATGVDLYATKVDYNGLAMWPSPLSVLSNATGNKFRVQLTPSYSSQGISQVVAVWEDERNGKDVFAQNIACDGSTGPLYTTGVSEMVKPIRNISVYPNPGSDSRLELFSENQQSVSISLFDATGRCVSFREQIRLVNGANVLELTSQFGNDVPKGVYMVRIQGAEAVEQVKWVRE